MTHHLKSVVLSMATIVAGLTGCGVTTEGISSAASQVAQPLSPPPPPPASVARARPLEMLEKPNMQEFSAFTVGEHLRIRYDTDAGQYQVMTLGRDWVGLVADPQSEPGLALFANQPDINAGYFSARVRYTHPTPEFRYQYSSLASWMLRVDGQSSALLGTIAFGSPTQASGVPSTGTARYKGLIEGEANVPVLSGWGNSDRAPVGGNVTLNFDFGNGRLTGQISPTLACDCEPIAFPTLDFTQTIFGKGNLSFSGKFDSTVEGNNGFSGIFTGPNAQELIGNWTFPFLFRGFPKEAAGVWIAKRD